MRVFNKNPFKKCQIDNKLSFFIDLQKVKAYEQVEVYGLPCLWVFTFELR
jgi:hypothetical protein